MHLWFLVSLSKLIGDTMFHDLNHCVAALSNTRHSVCGSGFVQHGLHGNSTMWHCVHVVSAIKSSLKKLSMSNVFHVMFNCIYNEACTLKSIISAGTQPALI